MYFERPKPALTLKTYIKIPIIISNIRILLLNIYLRIFFLSLFVFKIS